MSREIFVKLYVIGEDERRKGYWIDSESKDSLKQYKNFATIQDKVNKLNKELPLSRKRYSIIHCEEILYRDYIGIFLLAVEKEQHFKGFKGICKSLYNLIKKIFKDKLVEELLDDFIIEMDSALSTDEADPIDESILNKMKI